MMMRPKVGPSPSFYYHGAAQAGAAGGWAGGQAGSRPRPGGGGWGGGEG